MADLPERFHHETEDNIHDFLTHHKDVAKCAIYGTTEFLGASNACVCSRMGHTEAADQMRDGLFDQFLRTGQDDLWTHLKYIIETRNKPGGGLPLVTLIMINGLECPGKPHELLHVLTDGPFYPLP